MSAQQGREVVIVEAVRTPVGRGHPEKGYYKDLHPAALLGRTYVELLSRAGVDPSEVEDVLQETLRALHLSRHTYDAASPVTAWAHAIARYKLVDHLRRSGRHAGALPLDDEVVAPSPPTPPPAPPPIAYPAPLPAGPCPEDVSPPLPPPPPPFT